jgi:hypothetical protein
MRIWRRRSLTASSSAGASSDNGPSVRTLHVNLDDAMKEDSDQDADLVRISGKKRQNFRNPQSSRVNSVSTWRRIRSLSFISLIHLLHTHELHNSRPRCE